MDAREYRLFVWVLDNISASGWCGVCVCASALSLSCMLAFEDCIHACVCVRIQVCVCTGQPVCVCLSCCVCAAATTYLFVCIATEYTHLAAITGQPTTPCQLWLITTMYTTCLLTHS